MELPCCALCAFLLCLVGFAWVLFVCKRGKACADTKKGVLFVGGFVCYPVKYFSSERRESKLLHAPMDKNKKFGLPVRMEVDGLLEQAVVDGTRF